MVELGRRAFAAGAASVMVGAGGPQTAWDFSFPALEGGTLKLDDVRGQVLLVVNTASFCGYTYQYEQLQKLHDAMAGKRFSVIGIPSQDFNQESGTDAAVKDFCETTFGIEFPMSGLQHVRGPTADPFYAWVRADQGGWEPDWNFNKVLIGRDGRILRTFRSAEEPAGAVIRAAVTDAVGS